MIENNKWWITRPVDTQYVLPSDIVFGPAPRSEAEAFLRGAAHEAGIHVNMVMTNAIDDNPEKIMRFYVDLLRSGRTKTQHGYTLEWFTQTGYNTVVREGDRLWNVEGLDSGTIVRQYDAGLWCKLSPNGHSWTTEIDRSQYSNSLALVEQKLYKLWCAERNIQPIGVAE